MARGCSGPQKLDSFGGPLQWIAAVSGSLANCVLSVTRAAIPGHHHTCLFLKPLRRPTEGTPTQKMRESGLRAVSAFKEAAVQGNLNGGFTFVT
jgi:hypothetical protein